MGLTAARRSRLLLLVAASLLSTTSAAYGSTSAASARGAAARCEPTLVSMSPCLHYLAAVAPPLAASPPAPTGACCVAFLRAVYPSRGSGGDGCLCHLLRNQLLLGFPIDAARLGALLPACAARNSFATATLLADACRGTASGLAHLHRLPASTSSLPVNKQARGGQPAGPTCDVSSLAPALVDQCQGDTTAVPPRACCAAVLATVDNRDTGCLCTVSSEGDFVESALDVPLMWELYRRCGGKQRVPDTTSESCSPAPAAAPPPPPPPSTPPPPRRPPPTPPAAKPQAGLSHAGWIAVIWTCSVLGGTAVVIATVYGVKLAIRRNRARRGTRGTRAASHPDGTRITVPAGGMAPVDAVVSQSAATVRVTVAPGARGGGSSDAGLV